MGPQTLDQHPLQVCTSAFHPAQWQLAVSRSQSPKRLAGQCISTRVSFNYGAAVLLGRALSSSSGRCFRLGGASLGFAISRRPTVRSEWRQVSVSGDSVWFCLAHSWAALPFEYSEAKQTETPQAEAEMLAQGSSGEMGGPCHPELSKFSAKHCLKRLFIYLFIFAWDGSPLLSRPALLFVNQRYFSSLWASWVSHFSSLFVAENGLVGTQASVAAACGPTVGSCSGA